MATLAEIRLKYPQYNDIGDKELADALYAKSYRDMPRAEFDKRIGLKKPSIWDEGMGAATTLTRSIPFADEAGDALQAGVDIITGASKPSEAWRKARARSKAYARDFAYRHPTAAELVKGVGLAAQVAPALATSGGTVVPAASSAVAKRGLMASSARMLKPMADSAVVSGLYAQAGGYGGEGTLDERQKAANAATIPAMVIGAAIPPGVAVASKARRVAVDAARGTGRAAARLANRMTGGEILAPTEEAARRLGEALKADGLGPQEVRQALLEWQRSGASSPALMDLAGENTRALLRSAASKPGAGRNLAVGYANRVTADLQDNAIGRTRALTPDARTLPEIEGDIGRRIEAASTLDEVPAGSGGASVSEALNRRFDAARSGVDEAYNAARAASPEGAHLRSEDLPQVAANVREAVRDFHPDDIPSVARELAGLDKLSTPTVRDLYEMRQRLTGVRMSKPDQAAAAARAIRALDAEIQGAVERGAVTGDPEVVGLWRSAIGQRRQMGQQFEGDDLIQRLTERGQHGEGRTNLVAPEDASNAILGRNGVTQRQDLTRDLARMRDALGADSPEWATFQREASQRILGRDAGTEGFGTAWEAFARQNPQLAELLSTPEQRAALEAARQQIGGAVADREAVGLGRSVLNASPDRLAADASGLGERQPLAQVGAARELEDVIGRPAENATGLLNRLATGTNPGRNLAEIFGPDEAARYRDAIGREIERVGNARFISPNTGSQTAPRAADDALIDLPPMSKIGILKAIVDKVRRGITLTDAEREALLQLGTTIVRTGEDIPNLPASPQAQRLLTPAARARFARLLAAAQGAEQARAKSGAR
jgi:hypothetical protein